MSKTNGKKLSEMTLEELWRLFPISLTPHQERWRRDYEEMEERLKQRLNHRQIIGINHIGSTSVSNIWAKNIVDILVEIHPTEDLDAVADEIKGLGFVVMSSEKNRISMNYGYTEDGFVDPVFHLHLRYQGDHDELYFRDYLNAFPEVAKQYEAMKLSLWKEYEFDRDGYTDAKTDFIKKHTEEAKLRFGNRYENSVTQSMSAPE